MRLLEWIWPECITICEPFYIFIMALIHRSGEALKFKQDDKWIECVVPQLNDFEMILCIYYNK